MKPGSDLYAKRWVREFWRDQMKKQNAPDLPSSVTIDQFQKFSEQLAERLS